LILGAIAGAVVAGYCYALWQAPRLLNQRELTTLHGLDRINAEHNARLLVVSLGGALIVTVGLLYMARNYRLAHRRQVTDRFTKALERLGSDELYVRIGGVHALEHVMRDSAEHHADTVEVLIAFIRCRAPRAQDASRIGWLHPPAGSDGPPTEPGADIQAALTAVANRPRRLRRERGPLDLHQLHLQGTQLGGANLTRARLGGANLAGAQLDDANLTGTWLGGANLTDAWLGGANLTNALLGGANLTGAGLVDANLTDALLDDANLTDAGLVYANLTGARLGGANLTDALLHGANLTGAQLGGANLTGTQLVGANLTHAVLGGANLTGARLFGANLTHAVLGGANLTGAVLEGANLTGARDLERDQIEQAQGDARTKLPAGWLRPASWDRIRRS
jgi:uncharacterized protein YjbI with pentapeptide repeats